MDVRRSVSAVICVVLLAPLSACETTQTPSSKDECRYAKFLQGLQQATGRSGQATTDKDGNAAVAFGSVSYDDMVRHGLVQASDADPASRPVSYENVLLSKKPGEGVCGAALAYQTVLPRNR